MSEQDVEQRLARLEARLAAAEDRLAIYQLLASYGPSVDSLAERSVQDMWTKDGIYDAGGVDPFIGNANVGDLVNREPHQTYIAAGCAHVISMPHIRLDGDSAVATGYSRVYLRDGDHWRVERASANRWELVRTAAGWKVANRLNRPLVGSEEARAVLGGAVR